MQTAEAMRASGVDVVDLGAGEPDFDTPQNIKEAAATAMRAGKTKYTPTAGTRDLQKAIIQLYRTDFGAIYERNEVMATSGGKLRLCEMSPVIQQVFRTSNLDRLFTIDRDQRAALDSFR